MWGARSLGREAPPPTYKLQGARTLSCCSLTPPPEARALQAPNKHGRHRDPLMSHPALASPWCRQQEAHFHKRAEISSSINNTCSWVLGWTCYPMVPVQRVWWWPITTISHLEVSGLRCPNMGKPRNNNRQIWSPWKLKLIRNLKYFLNSIADRNKRTHSFLPFSL